MRYWCSNGERQSDPEREDGLPRPVLPGDRSQHFAATFPGLPK